MKFSFEIYPRRKSIEPSSFRSTVQTLAASNPEFISVTYGASGSGRRGTFDAISTVVRDTPIPVLAHLTCLGQTRIELLKVVDKFKTLGVADFLAIRGDAREDTRGSEANTYHRADQLVELLDAYRPKGGKIGIAGFPNGHPDSAQVSQDLDALKSKIDKGADFIVTQLFFENEIFYRYVDRVRSAGITVPIIPGLMPVVSERRLRRVEELTGDAAPSQLRKKFSGVSTEEDGFRLGTRWSADQISDLRDAGVESVHLFAFNDHRTVLETLSLAQVLSKVELESLN